MGASVSCLYENKMSDLVLKIDHELKTRCPGFAFAGFLPLCSSLAEIKAQLSRDRRTSIAVWLGAPFMFGLNLRPMRPLSRA